MSQPSANEQIARLITGAWMTQMVYAAAKLGLADRLNDGPRTAEQLAPAVGADAGALYRLLRALAAIGIFAEDGQRRFAMTPLAEPLRSDVPGSQRPMALMMGEEQYQAWGGLLYSVQTGKIAFDHIFGLPIFEYLGRHPDKGANFDAAMTSIHGRETGAMLDAYDLSGVKTLADVGGGNGSVLAAVLQRYPHMQGILADLPAVVGRTKAALGKAPPADRLQFAPGSFFESVPAGADAYLLRHIIHDWDDDKSLTILRNIRKVIRPDGRLLVVESVIAPGNAFQFAKLLDLTMLVAPGGLERTEEEYRKLFAAAGFRLADVTPTTADVSVIEGRPQ